MNVKRAKISVRGAVQGVGFRPFVYRLARELGLCGWVRNTGQGVELEIEGAALPLDQFLRRLEEDSPPNARLDHLECLFVESTGLAGFAIQPSCPEGDKSTVVMADLATCEDCLAEVFEPSNRRYLYPFTNCTCCGPRFSIIEALPYDRANTSMRKFRMCRACEDEYQNPSDRRFHAEPNACPNCGPQLALLEADGRPMAYRYEAVLEAVQALGEGRILAVKGLGGFQLMVDARNDEAVMRLRNRKLRMEKPFALMYPTLDSIREDCFVSEQEAALLQSPQAPIVLLEKRTTLQTTTSISNAVSPRNPWLGAMLPCTPLHHLLLREADQPLVTTSGNLSDEPICIDEQEALERFWGVADLLLIHDRPIVRHVDDSVTRVILGQEQVLRRARGYAPLPIRVDGVIPKIMGVGAQLKNTVAFSVEGAVVLSQHIGDLETGEACAAFERVAEDLPRLYALQPETVACDLHPDYLSTQYTTRLPIPRNAVQHHWAHVAACMADNQLEAPVLGVAWDGSGLGADGTLWGGEFLLAGSGDYQRVAHLRTFRLPGATAAIQQPRRAALGLLQEFIDPQELRKFPLPFLESFSVNELKLIQQMLANRLNAPITSSVGRLFDAVAAITGLRQRTGYEGQAAMELEFIATKGIRDLYSFQLCGSDPIILDWEPMVREILADVQSGVSIGLVSAKFHNSLAEMVVAVAGKIGQPKVALTGGCFQNKMLTEQTVRRLRQEGFIPYWHRQVPPNDGGIAVGQVLAASWIRRAQAVKAPACSPLAVDGAMAPFSSKNPLVPSTIITLNSTPL